MSVQALNQACARFRSARPGHRDTFRQSATAVALAVAKERDELVARMEKRWAWLDANGGHALFAEREDALLNDLRAYERIEDALRAAADVLYGDAA